MANPYAMAAWLEGFPKLVLHDPYGLGDFKISLVHSVNIQIIIKFINM